ncbi:hypothetical protein ASPZODRAFT_127330 [Penicilliopsis zonata CBS 506.65]|uniref:Uncharacterized protein n=1 Tax=Penicilliopsis zonata CBS 506.65 TaxID=1073090 RepID=A0A1L9SVR9_9EURO|nr:hypothetical protein ASPZODRAFT_127330 [Penicilliopsis zonata CBS 506.65]OJJ51279.1 hypothetical protein ASPZODRAFT_127330 [Penicilliopsis zonata CBS 506.65]
MSTALCPLAVHSTGRSPFTETNLSPTTSSFFRSPATNSPSAASPTVVAATSSELTSYFFRATSPSQAGPLTTAS